MGMNRAYISQAISLIDANYIIEAIEAETALSNERSAAGIRDGLPAAQGKKEALRKRNPPSKKRWLGTVAAVLAVAVLAGVFLRPGGMPDAYAIAEATYPEMAPYPVEYTDAAYAAWREGTDAQRRDLGDTSALRAFFARSTGTFLAGNEGQNRVYSPLNVYMALAMLAQLTGGESREQILTLLGSDNMDFLRQQAGDVWNANYQNDGMLTSILASSLWLNRNVKFKQKTMDTLARDFYASSYRGEMGSEEFNELLQGWLDEQTGGLLAEQAGNIEMKPEIILALATTVYFSGKWHNEFPKENTAPETFHTPDGDVEADFMRQRSFGGYYWGDRFTAMSQLFEQSRSRMWFILPDEGVTPEELLSDAEVMDFLFFGTGSYGEYEWENHKAIYVNQSIPKFDVSAQFDLTDGLRALGITDVFDPAVSDFTPMTTSVDGPIAVSQADHAARVVIDEEGCIAAAFTVILDYGMGDPPDDEVDFVLNRPFLFCITGNSGLPLFVGIVNYPAGG